MMPMGFRRNLPKGRRRQHFANRHVAEGAMQVAVHETLFPYYTSAPQRK